MYKVKYLNGLQSKSKKFHLIYTWVLLSFFISLLATNVGSILFSTGNCESRGIGAVLLGNGSQGLGLGIVTGRIVGRPLTILQAEDCLDAVVSALPAQEGGFLLRTELFQTPYGCAVAIPGWDVAVVLTGEDDGVDGFLFGIAFVVLRTPGVGTFFVRVLVDCLDEENFHLPGETYGLTR